MNDLFEDQLRAYLHAAAGRPAYDSIDPTEVIGEGRRVVRRRHRLQALGTAAAVAVLGVGGFLATDTGRTTTAPPAQHHSTAPVNRALLTLGDDGLGRFIGERTPGTDEVIVTDAADASRPVLASLLVPTGQRKIMTAALVDRGAVLALLPAGSHVLSVDTDTPSKDGGYRSDIQPLGEDVVLFGARFDDGARAQGAPRVLWRDGTDLVWDGDRPLASARFASPTDAAVPQLVWVDPANRLWGTSDPVGGSLSEKPLDAWALNSMGSVEPAGAANAGRGTFVITGLLPYADVSKLTATWAPGVTVVSPLQSQQLTSGGGTDLTAIHAVVTTMGEQPEQPEQLLQAVTFTGPDGQYRSHSYPKGRAG